MKMMYQASHQVAVSREEPFHVRMYANASPLVTKHGSATAERVEYILSRRVHWSDLHVINGCVYILLGIVEDYPNVTSDGMPLGMLSSPVAVDYDGDVTVVVSLEQSYAWVYNPDDYESAYDADIIHIRQQHLGKHIVKIQVGDDMWWAYWTGLWLSKDESGFLTHDENASLSSGHINAVPQFVPYDGEDLSEVDENETEMDWLKSMGEE